MASPRLQTFDRCEPSIAQYFVPEPCAQGSLIHFRIRGMFPPALADAVVRTIEAWLVRQTQSASQQPLGSWAAVTLAGFPDTPVAWRTHEPGLGLALGSGQSLHASTSTQPTPSPRKARGKGVVRRGESEHGILRTGENGWTAFLFHSRATISTQEQNGTLFVESVELDTHS